MKQRPKLAHFGLTLSVGLWKSAVGKEYDQYLMLQVHPEGCACKAQVTYTLRRKTAACTGAGRRWGVKTKGPRAAGVRTLDTPKFLKESFWKIGDIASALINIKESQEEFCH